MIIKQLEVPKPNNQSFQIRRDYAPKHHQIWHYHEELEVVHILAGAGTLFIGDRIKSFQPGETILIPTQTAHYWLFDAYNEEPQPLQEINCIVLHFKKDLGTPRLFLMPELLPVKQLIEQSERGFSISEEHKSQLLPLFETALNSSGIEKLSQLFKLLEAVQQLEKEALTSANYSILNQSEDQFRMNNLMDYIREHYKQKIKLHELASIAGLTENSFCRYFKLKTGKTPIQFITELRISHACSQLRNSQMNLKEICYDSGFNNFVSFHKNFKQIIGQTPVQFRASK